MKAKLLFSALIDRFSLESSEIELTQVLKWSQTYKENKISSTGMQKRSAIFYLVFVSFKVKAEKNDLFLM